MSSFAGMPSSAASRAALGCSEQAPAGQAPLACSACERSAPGGARALPVPAARSAADPRRGARPRAAIDLGLLDPATQRLGVNTKLTAHPGQLTMVPAFPLPDLQDHPHRAFAQLTGVLPLCRHDSA